MPSEGADPYFNNGIPDQQAKEMGKLNDVIDHPSHYVEGRKFEPADVIIDWKLSWALGNAVKYISRAGRKGDAAEDLGKAIWYLKKEITRIEMGL